MTLIAARAFGATKIMMTDISTHNLALADKMGATKTYCHSKAASPQDIASKLKDMLGPSVPEIVFDCVGMESTIRTAIFTAAPGSKIVVVGLGQENATVPLSMLTLCELDVLGSMRYTNTVRNASLFTGCRISLCIPTALGTICACAALDLQELVLLEQTSAPVLATTQTSWVSIV